MQTMFVANCTQQIQHFAYRLPEGKRAYTQEIAIGGQIRVAGRGNGELTPIDIESIIQQHAKYGFTSVDEIDRTRPFVGMCFSLDKPVRVNKIEHAIEHNQSVLIKRGEEIRENAAVGVHNKIAQDIPGLKGLELQTSELDDPKSGRVGKFAEGTRVDTAAPRVKPKRGK